MKKIIFVCILLLSLSATRVNAIDILFEHRTWTELARGVVLEENRMMTSRGMLDVQVIFVDLNAPYITLSPVVSSREWGLRETTQRLISDAGAVAGINADFFSVARLHTRYYGPMVNDGQVLSLNAASDFATFLLDVEDNPFFKYLRPNMRLVANGEEITTIRTYNSFGADITETTVISRAAMYDTAHIDDRIENLTKIVVENGVVTYISAAGATVATPENGFVVLVTPDRRDRYLRRMPIGTNAEFRIGTNLNVDFTAIRAAIGGGAVVIQNGEIIPNRGVQPNARHPRTAVGQLRDGRIVLVTVDGRTHSVGVTHEELGNILLRYGVTNAMHMDGGGSTTMVARMPNGVFTVANTPSDGGQRRVSNALGVFDYAPISDKIRLAVRPAETRGIMGIPLPVDVLGEDFFGNLLPLQYGAEPVFVADPLDGFWNDGMYTPLRTGRHMLNARLGGFIGSAEIYVFSLAELQPSANRISLLEGERQRLRFTGITSDGLRVTIPVVTGLSVNPPYLGTFEGNYFVAGQGGSGIISASVGSVRAYIAVTVGGVGWPVDMFGDGVTVGSIAYPSDRVSANVFIESMYDRQAIRMNYGFVPSNVTLAAYTTIYPAIELPGEPIALTMEVYGNNSGHWLRARVRDASGTRHNIDFTEEIDFYGWQTLTARMPQNAPAPFTLDRIYAVALEHDYTLWYVLRFYGLSAIYMPNHVTDIPQNTVFTDRLSVSAEFFAGLSGGRTHTFDIPMDEGDFSVTRAGDFAVARLNVQSGRIVREEWRYFIPQIQALNTPNVLILINGCPIDLSSSKEFELFHLAMTDLREEGRHVFIASPTSADTFLIMRDGVRYIRVNENDAAIRFFTDSARVFWNA